MSIDRDGDFMYCFMESKSYLYGNLYSIHYSKWMIECNIIAKTTIIRSDEQ